MRRRRASRGAQHYPPPEATVSTEEGARMGREAPDQKQQLILRIPWFEASKPTQPQLGPRRRQQHPISAAYDFQSERYAFHITRIRLSYSRASCYRSVWDAPC